MLFDRRKHDGRPKLLSSSTNDDGTDAAEDGLNAKTALEGRVSADAIALQQRVDILTARLKSMEAETLKQMQENVGLKSDIMATKDEESQRFVSLLLSGHIVPLN